MPTSTIVTPIVINNLSDLQAIQNNLSGYYVLGANIDAAGFSFTPIGGAANPFTGIFDGQGYTISNLTINNVSNTDSGLFGDIGAIGTVRNVGLINESVTSSSSHVGGLVGENFGTITQSYVEGNIGGVSSVGGLVGLNSSSGSISQSYAAGQTATHGGTDAGGLVGVNQGAISESYATGSVNPATVSVVAGGLVGINSGSITQSYATGLVGGGGGFALGGLVGLDSGAGTDTASYWDTQTGGRSTSAGGTGLTTAQLESGILPAGFDPTIWFDVVGQFPELRWQAPPININHAPVASTIAANANEDTNLLPVTLTALFTDADLSDTFTFSDDATGTIGLVTNKGDGTFIYDPNGKFESLGVGETATDTFTYTVTDNHGASSTATATVTIHGENDLPVASPDVAVTQKGTTIGFDAAHGVLANDTDPDIHDVLHVSAVNGLDFNVGQIVHGTYGALTLKADGSYSYVAKNDLGSAASTGATDSFTYTVDDGHGGQTTSVLTIDVLGPQAKVPATTSGAGTLVDSGVETGVTPQEILNIAEASAAADISWTKEGCAAFVWGVTNLAGLPFFDMSNHAINGNPLTPDNNSYLVPHSLQSGAGIGDPQQWNGWDLVVETPSASTLLSSLESGDVVRVYRSGDLTTEPSFVGQNVEAHSFIFAGYVNGTPMVIDNWDKNSSGQTVIEEHSLYDITKKWAPAGKFEDAFVYRVDQHYVDSHVQPTIQGNGVGDFWHV
jgi:VCBS repeat-containing protein